MNRFNNKNTGQAIITAVIFFLFSGLAISFAIVGPLTRETKVARLALDAKKSYFIAEASYEDVLFRLKTGKNISDEEVLTIDGESATTTIINLGGNDREIVSKGEVNKSIRKIRAEVTVATGGNDINFGVQTHNGGVFMENFSSVEGNIYSNGPVRGANNNLTTGSVVSAGQNGLIDNIYTQDDAYAHTIKDSDIEGDAYYQVIQNTGVDGIEFPGSSDKATSTLPLSDEQIEEWKTLALLGGVHTSPCPYTIDSNTSLGPIKIECDLKIQNDPLITIYGWIWVEGNIEIENSSQIKLDSSLGKKSSGFIADNPSDTRGSGRIILSNSSAYINTGTEGTFVIMISQNNDSEMGGSTPAINIKNFAEGSLMLYAGHGEVLIENNTELSQVTGYLVHLKNSAKVIYESGLASILFTSGPGGSWVIKDWKEVE